MRKLDISHWENTDKLEGLLFFSQLIDEMLFDYTLDSYKPLALNSRLLCIECFETIEEIKNGYIPKKSIISIVEELKWSLSKDTAAKSIFGVKFEQYIEKLKFSDSKIHELENIVGLFYNSFQSRKYLKSIIENLTILITSGKDKSKIKSLTSSFLTELINYGYNQNYIYYQNLNFFFNKLKKDKITKPQDIEGFFQFFDFEEKEFTAVFKGGNIFKNFKDTLNDFDIVVTNNYNCFSTIPEDVSFKKERKVNESFIICSKIEALDHHSARNKAEKLLGQICNLFNFYHHRTKPEILEKAIVSRISDNYVVIIDKQINSVLKSKSDENPNEAAKSVENTLTKLNLDTDSTHRFARSIDLHSAALTANAIENQLLDFWAALETLLPKITESNKDRIVQICDSIIPFLQLNYTHKLLLELHKDLTNWNETKTNQVLSKIPDSKDFSILEKTGALISLEDNKNLREELYSELSDFPLLKNRIFTLHESFKSVENIENTLKSHETKINWHLRRIYRTRGQIIHSGKYPSFTPILIENLHSYIDLFINKILDLSTNEKINSIEQGVLELDVSLQFQIQLLKKHRGENLNITNFREALLGEKQNASA
jgi:hypothetical protein